MPGRSDIGAWRVRIPARRHRARATRWVALGLLLGLTGGPLAADAFDDLAPCLTRQSSLDTLTETFVAAGWTIVADGPERDRVAAATSEISWALRSTPNRFRTAEQVEAFVEKAHRSHELRSDPYTLLSKGPLDLILEWSANSRRGQNICLLVADRLDYVTAAIPARIRDAANPPALSVIDILRMRAPPDIKYVKTALIRLRSPQVAPDRLAGADGVRMSVSYALK